ncbi:hypothetical protein WA026_001794 [Henosepilachna vigintioctopunctata]|uniref:Uncharacterized protein n=1 Tax=Henosepilachna vigintioctopunctata TaxID=420089 RepID=A0AAW1UUV3_9CUCU
MKTFKFPMEFFDNLCIAITPIPIFIKTTNSLPSYYTQRYRPKRRAPLSMYSSPHFMHCTNYGYPIASVHRHSQSTLGSSDYQNFPLHYASRFSCQRLDINDTNNALSLPDALSSPANDFRYDLAWHCENELNDNFYEQPEIVGDYKTRGFSEDKNIFDAGNNFRKSCTTIAEEESLGEI